MIETIERVLQKHGLAGTAKNVVANAIADALEEKFDIQRKPDSWDRKIALDIEERAVLEKEKNPGIGWKLLRVKIAHDMFGMGMLEAKSFVERYWTHNGVGGLK